MPVIVGSASGIGFSTGVASGQLSVAGVRGAIGVLLPGLGVVGLPPAGGLGVGGAAGGRAGGVGGGHHPPHAGLSIAVRARVKAVMSTMARFFICASFLIGLPGAGSFL